MDVTSLIVIVLVTALTTAAIVGLVVSRAMKNQGGLSAQDIRQQVADCAFNTDRNSSSCRKFVCARDVATGFAPSVQWDASATCA
jgi:hypothetical protein